MNIDINKSTRKRFLIHKTSSGNIGMFFEGMLMPIIFAGISVFTILSSHYYDISLFNYFIMFIFSLLLYKSIKMHRFTLLEGTLFDRVSLDKMAEHNNWKILRNSENIFVADVKSKYWFTTIYLILISEGNDSYLLLYPETAHLKAVRFPLPRIVKENIMIEFIKGYVKSKEDQI